MKNNKNVDLLNIIKNRVNLMNKVDNNILARQKRIAKLKSKNWFISEAAPPYKESYTKS